MARARPLLHERLPPAERFAIGADLLHWYRDGGPERVLNNTAGDNCGGPAYAGVRRVLPAPVYYHHKGGLVDEYRLSVHHVRDDESGTEYFAAIAVDTSAERPVQTLAEAIARMAQRPGHYVHLGFLRDHVNPVTADLVTVSPGPAALDLVVKPYAEDGLDPNGWRPLAGSRVAVRAGTTAHTLRSSCLDRSEQVHIRGRLVTEAGIEARSDLHYVIVDVEQPCDE